MTWPPDPLPNNRSNITPQLDNHPTDHNDIANTLAEDFVPQVSDNLAAIGVNAGAIGVNAGGVAGNAAAIGTINALGTLETILRSQQNATNRVTTNTAQLIMSSTINPARASGHILMTITFDVSVNTVNGGSANFIGELFVGGVANPNQIVFNANGLTQGARYSFSKTWVLPVSSAASVVYDARCRQGGANQGDYTVMAGAACHIQGFFIG